MTKKAVPALSTEILQKICHHIACIYKDALPNKSSYDKFMDTALKVSSDFANEAFREQQFAAGGLGIQLSDVPKQKLQKIIYYSVLSNMTNPEKFQEKFNAKVDNVSVPAYQKPPIEPAISSQHI